MPQLLLLTLLGGIAACGNKSYVCESAADCVISCEIAGDCCGAGCGCDFPYHVDQAAAIAAANKSRCEGKQLDCPYYTCPEVRGTVVATCENKKCAAMTISDVCATDDDCVVSCARLGSCCTDTCECATAVTRAFAAHVAGRNEAVCADANQRCDQLLCPKSTETIDARCQNTRCTAVRTPLPAPTP